MKTKQYKNKYRREICDLLGKIKNTYELQNLLQMAEMYARWDSNLSSVEDVERYLIILHLFNDPGPSEEGLRLARRFLSFSERDSVETKK